MIAIVGPMIDFDVKNESNIVDITQVHFVIVDKVIIPVSGQPDKDDECDFV